MLTCAALPCYARHLAQDADEAIEDRERQALEDTYKLAFNEGVSIDGFVVGLNLEQTAKVNTEGRFPKKPLDMV